MPCGRRTIAGLILLGITVVKIIAAELGMPWNDSKGAAMRMPSHRIPFRGILRKIRCTAFGVCVILSMLRLARHARTLRFAGEKMKVLSLLLFLSCIGAVPAAHSAPIQYNLIFSGTNIPIGTNIPTSGSFVFDAVTNTFSDFSIVWNTLTFDLTGSANSPHLAWRMQHPRSGLSRCFQSAPGRTMRPVGSHNLPRVDNNQLYHRNQIRNPVPTRAQTGGCTVHGRPTRWYHKRAVQPILDIRRSHRRRRGPRAINRSALD